MAFSSVVLGKVTSDGCELCPWMTEIAVTLGFVFYRLTFHRNLYEPLHLVAAIVYTRDLLAFVALLCLSDYYL